MWNNIFKSGSDSEFYYESNEVKMIIHRCVYEDKEFFEINK